MFSPGEVSSNVPSKSHFLMFALFSSCKILFIVFQSFKKICVASSIPGHIPVLHRVVFSPTSQISAQIFSASLVKQYGEVFTLKKKFFFLFNTSFEFSDNLF